MAGKGGGAWKVAYADFVTAMMAFFLVMWIVAQNKPVKEAVANYFKDPSGSGRAAGPGQEGGAPAGRTWRPNERDTFATGTTKPNMNVVEDGDGEKDKSRSAVQTHRIAVAADEDSTLGTQVLFEEDSAELSEKGKQVLDRVTPALLGKLNKIEIRGHSSGRRLPGDSPYKNAWELSYARSVSAMDRLVTNGIDPRRIRLSQSGANDPNLKVDAAEGRVSNSRVEVYVLNEFATDPADAEHLRTERAKKATPRESAPAGSGGH